MKAAPQIIVDRLRSQWNAPPKHAAKRLKELDCAGRWGEKLASLSGKIGTGFTVALVGERGPGKTQLAVCLMKAVTRQGRSAYYCTALEFFLNLKATFGERGRSELEEVNKLKAVDLLVVDEYGKKADGEWHNNLIFEVLNWRYAATGKDTILIDNRTKSEFVTYVGPSLASRMDETGGIVVCDWKSYRK